MIKIMLPMSPVAARIHDLIHDGATACLVPVSGALITVRIYSVTRF